jgi:hypothetical protein
MYTAEMGSGGMIVLPSFMKIGAGFQAILWVFLNNLNNCNVAITGERNYDFLF